MHVRGRTLRSIEGLFVPPPVVEGSSEIPEPSGGENNIPCPAGFFQHISNSAACMACPAGYTSAAGSTTASDCAFTACPVGYTGDEGSGCTASTTPAPNTTAGGCGLSGFFDAACVEYSTFYEHPPSYTTRTLVTLNPQTSTLSPQPSSLNPSPEHQTLHPTPHTLRPTPYILHLTTCILHP